MEGKETPSVSYHPTAILAIASLEHGPSKASKNNLLNDEITPSIY